MTRRSLALSIVTTLLAVAGCGSSEGSTQEEPIGTTTEALLAGVPQKAWLEIAVAEFDPAGLKAPASIPTAGAPAPECKANGMAGLADLSATVSTTANGMLGGVLRILSDFTKQPPTAHDDHHATWGPVTGTEPKGTFRFDVERNADGTIGFQLAAQKPGATEFVGLFRGATRVVDKDHRVGDVQIDLAQLHAIDPERNKATAGAVAIHFGNVDGAVGIDMTFANADGPEAPPTNAKYRFMRRPDGAGAFDFVAHVASEPGKAEKVLHVTTAWSPGGAGKSRAVEMVAGTPGPSQLVECWAPNAGLVFHTDASTTIGNPACCTNAPDGP